MGDKDAWKTEYEREYKRTTGRDVTIVVRGGWVELHENGGWPSGAYRKADIIRMTERLKTRPDMTANGEVRGASRLAGEASSAEGATSTVVLEPDNGGKHGKPE